MRFLHSVCALVFIVITLSAVQNTSAGELDVSLRAIYATCVGEEMLVDVDITNTNADFDIGVVESWVEVTLNGNLVYTSPRDERPLDKGQEKQFTMETGWVPTMTGTYDVKLRAEGEFAINGQQTDDGSITVCPRPVCPPRPTASDSIIYLGSASSGSLTYTATPNCCYRIRLTIVTGRDVVTSHSPSDWVEINGSSTDVTIAVDRAKWGSKYIVARLDYISCDDQHRGSDYILVRDGERAQASASTPQPPGVTTGQTPGAATEADPVNTALGEMTAVSVVDAEVIGKLPVREIRSYASMLPRALNTDQSFGPGWSSSFDSKAVVTPAEAYILRPSGQVVRFRNTGKSYELDWPRHRSFTLSVTPDATVFADPVEHRVYTFNPSGNLTAIADGYGFSLELRYNQNQLEGVYLPSGKGLTYSHNEQGRISSITDGEHTTRYNYNASGILQSVVHPNDGITTYQYARGHLLASILTPENRSAVTTTYDNNDRVATQDYGEGIVASFSYADKSTSLTLPLSQPLVHTYNNNQQIIELKDPRGNTATFGYNADGQRTTVTDREGGETSRTFMGGLPSQITHADGGVWQYEYQARQYQGIQLYELTKVTMPNDAEISIARDAMGRPTSMTHPLGTRTYTYDQLGNALGVRGLGLNLNIEYNTDGLATKVIDNNGLETEFSYNNQGFVTQTSLDGVPTSSRTFNAHGNVETAWNVGKGSLRLSYDNDGRVTSIGNGTNDNYLYDYDTRGRLSSLKNPEGGGLDLGWLGGFVVSYDFGNNQRYTSLPTPTGGIAQATGPNGTAWNFTYDKADGIASYERNGGARYNFQTDDMGRPTSVATVNGAVNNVSYDELGRIVHRGGSGAIDQQLEWANDLAGVTVSSGVHTLGISTTFGTSDQLATTIIDANGNTWKREALAAGMGATYTSPTGRTRTVRTNAFGQPQSVDYGNNMTANWEYLTDNETRYSVGDFTTSWKLDANYRPLEYGGLDVTTDKAGRITQIGNTQYTRLPIGRTQQIVTEGGLGFTYSFDNRGYVNKITDTEGGETNVTFDEDGRLTNVAYPNGFETSYQWRDDNQVQKVSHGNEWSIEYNYNSLGLTVGINRRLIEELQVDYSSASHPMQYNADNEVVGGTYDGYGNLTGLPTTPQLTYNGAFLHSFEWNGQTTNVKTDPEGYPVEYKNNDTEIKIDWSVGLKARYPLRFGVNGDSWVNVVLPNGKSLYRFNDDGERVYHLDDGRGNIVLETNEQNEVTGGRAYSPHGSTIGSYGNPFILGFKGSFGAITLADDQLQQQGRVSLFAAYGLGSTNTRAFIGFPATDNPSTENQTLRGLGRFNVTLGSGFPYADESDLYRSACDIDDEDFTFPIYRDRIWFGEDGNDLTPRFRLPIARDENNRPILGGLSAGVIRGLEYGNNNLDANAQKYDDSWRFDDSWRVGLKYQWERGIRLSVGYSDGYEAPSQGSEAAPVHDHRVFDSEPNLMGGTEFFIRLFEGLTDETYPYQRQTADTKVDESTQRPTPKSK